MIDFIKIAIPSTYEGVLRNVLPCNFEVKGDTSEILSGTEYSIYNGLKIHFTNKCIIISGSLHKFYNLISGQGFQNYDDFTIDKLIGAIRILSDALNFDPNIAIIQNVEFGVNINFDGSPKEYLSKSVIYHNFKRPSSRKTFQGRGYFLEFEHGHYWLKIYDKGLQYSRNNSILRCEIKTRKSCVVRELGIGSLGDLMEANKLHQLGNLLLERIDQLVTLDTLNLSFIEKKRDAEFIKNMISNGYLQQIISTKSERQVSRYNQIEEFNPFL